MAITEKGFLTARIAGDPGESHVDDRRVPWWSFTKTALAAAALQLVACGNLTLDGRIGSHPYTLRQLLQHQAGVPNYGSLASYQEAVRRGERPWPIDRLLERVQAGHLDFEPGHGWRYSNVGYFFVRRLIEEVTGRDLDSALRYLVFDVLGLESVSLASSAGDLIDTAWGNRHGYDPGWVYHGLLLGSPADAARLLHGLMSGALLPPALLADMKRRHPIGGPVKNRPWETTGYGLGLMMGRMTAAGDAIGHSGGGPGSVSTVYYFPDRTPPCTIAAFAEGEEGVAEHEVARLAQQP